MKYQATMRWQRTVSQIIVLALLLMMTNDLAAQIDKPSQTKESFLGQFSVDVVIGDKSQLEPAKQLPSGSYHGIQNKYFRGWVFGIAYDRRGARYIVQVKENTIISAPQKMPDRYPLRITLHDVPGKLSWTIDNDKLARLSSSGREAFLEFNGDGIVNLVVRSEDGVVFRIRARSWEEEKIRWVGLVRTNEAGEEVDNDGKVIK